MAETERFSPFTESVILTIYEIMHLRGDSIKYHISRIQRAYRLCCQKNPLIFFKPIIKSSVYTLLQNMNYIFVSNCNQFQATVSSLYDEILTWKLFHFHWVEIPSCLKRFLYILLCFCPSCHNLPNPILPLITELIIWIHHETLYWVNKNLILSSPFRKLWFQNANRFVTFEYRACS